MKKIQLYIGLLKIPLDFILMVLAFISVYHFRLSPFAVSLVGQVSQVSFYNERDNFILEYAVPLSLFLVLILAYNQVYSFKSSEKVLTQIRYILNAVLFWIGAIISYFFLVRDFPFSRFVLLGSAILVLVYLAIGRAIYSLLEVNLLRRGIGVKKVVLVVNDKKPLTKLLKALNLDIRYEVVGYISQVKLKNQKLKYYGVIEDLERILMSKDFEDLIQVGDVVGSYKNQDIIDLCRFFHKEYLFVPEVFQVQRHNIELSEIAGLPIFKVKPTPLDGWGRVVKRLFDIVFSALGLLFLAPFLLIVAILIKLDSKGPVLFKHTDEGEIIYRIGQKGNPFYCYKFRTMQVNTHKLRYEELADYDMRKGSPLVKIKNDPRVTRLGKFLRRFDIDELPQLWNVLKGNMSLIGPRPHLKEEVGKYERHHKFVLTVKPGITGMAQVSGRSDLEFEDEIKLDTFYIENWSLWLDCKILLKTVLIVIKGHNEFN